MSLNTSRIDRSFSPNEVTDLSTAFSSVEQIFDFHQGVSPQDFTRMLKVGTNSRRFVQEVKTTVDDFPWLLPGFITKPQFDAGYELFFQLDDMEAYLESLISRVQSTKIIAGHHLMRDSLDVYAQAQHAVHRGVSGVAPYLTSMEVRFAGNGNSGAGQDGDQDDTDDQNMGSNDDPATVTDPSQDSDPSNDPSTNGSQNP